MEIVTTLQQALAFFATNTTGTILCVYRENKKDEQTCIADNSEQATAFFTSLPVETPQQEFARKYNKGLI